MDNTLAKQTQFPFFPRNSFNDILSQTALAQFNFFPYLTNYLPTRNPNGWPPAANQAPTCSSPISPSSNSTSGRCPICLIPMQGIDANQHFLEEVQKLETLRRNKENEEKCKMDIIDVDIENPNNEQSFFLQLAKRNSRFLSRYQTYLRIKANREERKMRSYRTQKRRPDDKLINPITPPGMSLGHLNQFSLSAAAAAHNNLQNNLHLLHQQQQAAQQHLANQQAAAQHQQNLVNAGSNASSLLNLNGTLNGLLLNAVAAASCNSPATSNSNQTVCLENVESSLPLSNGALNASHNAGNGLAASLGNSQSNGAERATPGSKSSTPLTNLSSMNGGVLNGIGPANGNTTPTSTKTSSPVTSLSSLNCSNNVVSSHTKTPPNSTIWSIASITGLNAVANNLQNLNSLNNLSNLANDNLKRRCLTDDEDEDLEVTDVADDRDSISSYK